MKNITLTHKLAALASTAMLLTSILSTGIASAEVANGTLSAGAGGSAGVSFGAGTLELTGTTAITSQATGLTGSLSATVTDSRLSALGWSLASSFSSDFLLQGSDINVVNQKSDGSASAGTVSAVTGYYTGYCATADATLEASTILCGKVTVTVATVDAGSILTATATDAAGTSFPVTINSNASLTVAGLTTTHAGTWEIGDKMMLMVDKLAVASDATYGDVTAFTATTGETTGIILDGALNPGYVEAISRDDVVAPAGTGMGVFTFTWNFTQAVHGYAQPGTYKNILVVDFNDNEV